MWAWADSAGFHPKDSKQLLELSAKSNCVLVKETKLPKAECEKAFEAVAKVDFKDLAGKLPEGIADKIPSGITKKFGL